MNRFERFLENGKDKPQTEKKEKLKKVEPKHQEQCMQIQFILFQAWNEVMTECIMTNHQAYNTKYNEQLGCFASNIIFKSKKKSLTEE